MPLGQYALGVEAVPVTKFGDPSSNRFCTIHKRGRQTDRRTDRALTIAHPMQYSCAICIGGLKIGYAMNVSGLVKKALERNSFCYISSWPS